MVGDARQIRHQVVYQKAVSGLGRQRAGEGAAEDMRFTHVVDFRDAVGVSYSLP